MTNNVSDCIGNTPLVKITDKVYAKLETGNPSGSIKDRMARFIIDRAEERGELKPGDTIVEATSGNTGIALAMIAASRGYKMIAVMPSNMSEERKKMIRAFGGHIVEVAPADFIGAVKKRNELLKELGAFNPNQFSNPDNVKCHCITTGSEIIKQADDLGIELISAFVAGVGTGGTLIGVAQALLEKYPVVQTIGVEPSESAAMSNGPVGEHSIQGIGDGFIPELADMNKIDKVITISSQDAINRMKRLSTELGLLVGISSGANVLAAERYVDEYNPKGYVVTVLPDRQERYLSMLSRL